MRHQWTVPFGGRQVMLIRATEGTASALGRVLEPTEAVWHLERWFVGSGPEASVVRAVLADLCRHVLTPGAHDVGRASTADLKRAVRTAVSRGWLLAVERPVTVVPESVTGADAAPLRPAEGEAAQEERREEEQGLEHIEIVLVDESGAPIAGELCRVTFPDGHFSERATNEWGIARFSPVPRGQVEVCFVKLDQEAWSRA